MYIIIVKLTRPLLVEIQNKIPQFSRTEECKYAKFRLSRRSNSEFLLKRESLSSYFSLGLFSFPNVA
jgi:hypothetical protein